MLLYRPALTPVVVFPSAVAVVVTGAAGAAAAVFVFSAVALVGVGSPPTRICGMSISRTPFVSVAVAMISAS